MDVNHELISLLLNDTSGSIYLYGQEGVCLQPTNTDPIVGSLFVIENGSHYILWAPYTYLFVIARQKLSHAALSTVAGGLTIPTISEDSKDALQLPEWKTVLCFPLYRLSKVARRGRRIKSITFYRDGTLEEPPLRFQDGGCPLFWSILERLVVLRGGEDNPEEFVVDHSEAVVADLLHTSAPLSMQQSAPVPSQPEDDSSFAFHPFPQTEEAARDPTVFWNDPLSVVNVQDEATSTMQHEDAIAPTTKSLPVGRTHASAANTLAAHEKKVLSLVLPPSDRNLESPLTMAKWESAFNSEGSISQENWESIKRIIFEGGIQTSALRVLVWPFLLGMYDVSSTREEREVLRCERAQRYEELKQQWCTIRPDQAARFSLFRERQSAVDTDITRTDRTLPAYQGKQSPALASLQRIVMTYCWYNFDLGYCQGMTDVASPLLLLFEEEADAFWAFASLMDKQMQWNFQQKGFNSMTQQLGSIRHMLRHFVPTLYEYLDKKGALDLTYLFRWLLVRFKREFPVEDVYLLWEVSWSCPYTFEYHLLIALAVLRELTPGLLSANVSIDDLHRIFNQSSYWFHVRDVISHARQMYLQIVDQYRRRLKVDSSTLGKVALSELPLLEEILSAYPETKF